MSRDIRQLLAVVLCCAATHAHASGRLPNLSQATPPRPTRAALPSSAMLRDLEAGVPPPPGAFPIWRQNRGYWANLTLRGMRGTIGQFGCAVTAAAMQFRGLGKLLGGKPVDPALLNASIRILSLENMATVVGMKYREVDDVDEALARGPVIAQIRYHVPPSIGGGIGPHYVLLVGKDARGRVMVHDPLVGRRPLDPKRSRLDVIEHAYQIY